MRIIERKLPEYPDEVKCECGSCRSILMVCPDDLHSVEGALELFYTCAVCGSPNVAGSDLKRSKEVRDRLRAFDSRQARRST